jgi:CBS domain-containing protein
MEVLSTMSRTQNSRFLVIEGDRLVGVVTLKDMLRFLSLKLELEEPKGADVRFAPLSARKEGLSPGLNRSRSA